MRKLYHTIQQLPLFPTKVCTKCHKDKDLDEFHHEKYGKFERKGACKDCCARPGRPRRIKRSTKLGYKICNTCHAEKRYAEFALDSAQKDGYAGRCNQCKSERYHALPEEEKEIIRKRDRENRIPRREQIRERDRKRHNTDEHNANRREQMALKKALDPDFCKTISQANAEWRKKNPLHMREYSRRYKTRQKVSRSGYVDYQRILERDGMYCYICDRDILAHHQLAFDHKVPLHPRKGEPKGTHTEDNIHPTHKECNLRKANKQFENLTSFSRRGVD